MCQCMCVHRQGALISTCKAIVQTNNTCALTQTMPRPRPQTHKQALSNLWYDIVLYPMACQMKQGNSLTDRILSSKQAKTCVIARIKHSVAVSPNWSGSNGCLISFSCFRTASTCLAMLRARQPFNGHCTCGPCFVRSALRQSQP